METIKIKNPKKDMSEIVVVENKNVFKRKGRNSKGIKIRCICKYDGKNKETATPYRYENNKMYCPDCGKQIEVIRTAEEMQKVEEEKSRIAAEKKIKARENICLRFETQSISSGLKYYGLSTRIGTEEWKKISHLFAYHNSSRDYDDDEQDTWDGSGLNGWLTTNPGEVEKILNVKSENTIAYRNKESLKKGEKKEKIKTELQKIKIEIKRIFETAEYPWRDDKKHEKGGMIDYPSGEEIESPLYPFDLYGGGKGWMIDEEGNTIWEIRNNGMDGDDWSRNNISGGGAGYIGMRVPYSPDLEKQIREAVRLEKRLKG